MTHRERAADVTATFLGGPMPAAGEFLTAEAWLAELAWRACVDASNDELARRREVEAARDRAIRIQSALETRNEQLEGWLKSIDAITSAPGWEAYSGNVASVRQILGAFQCETDPSLPPAPIRIVLQGTEFKYSNADELIASINAAVARQAQGRYTDGRGNYSPEPTLTCTTPAPAWRTGDKCTRCGTTRGESYEKSMGMLCETSPNLMHVWPTPAPAEGERWLR